MLLGVAGIWAAEKQGNTNESRMRALRSELGLAAWQYDCAQHRSRYNSQVLALQEATLLSGVAWSWQQARLDKAVVLGLVFGILSGGSPKAFAQATNGAHENRIMSS